MGLALPGTRRRRDGACAAQAFCQRQNLGLGQFELSQTGWKQGPRKRPCLLRGGSERPAGGQADGLEIDIKPASAPADEEPEDEADVLLDDEAETEE